MEQLEKTSTPVYKRCCKCGTSKPRGEFYATKHHSDGLMSCCKTCNLAYVRLYQKRPYVRQRGNARNKLYQRTEHGREVHRRANAKYRESARGELVRRLERRRYVDSGRKNTVDMARYYRIQDLAGCHNGYFVDELYHGYKIIKALETAEVVEIKP